MVGLNFMKVRSSAWIVNEEDNNTEDSNESCRSSGARNITDDHIFDYK